MAEGTGTRKDPLKMTAEEYALYLKGLASQQKQPTLQGSTVVDVTKKGIKSNLSLTDVRNKLDQESIRSQIKRDVTEWGKQPYKIHYRDQYHKAGHKRYKK